MEVSPEHIKVYQTEKTYKQEYHTKKNESFVIGLTDNIKAFPGYKINQ